MTGVYSADADADAVAAAAESEQITWSGAPVSRKFTQRLFPKNYDSVRVTESVLCGDELRLYLAHWKGQCNKFDKEEEDVTTCIRELLFYSKKE